MSTGLATVSASCRLSNEPGRGLLTMRGQHVVTDWPPLLGGPNEAPNPGELLLAALAACATFVCERAAQREQLVQAFRRRCPVLTTLSPAAPVELTLE